MLFARNGRFCPKRGLARIVHDHVPLQVNKMKNARRYTVCITKRFFIYLLTIIGQPSYAAYRVFGPVGLVHLVTSSSYLATLISLLRIEEGEKLLQLRRLIIITGRCVSLIVLRSHIRLSDFTIVC